MAAKRESVIFNNDAGYWFKRNGLAGGAVNLSVGAERYDNITDFQSLIPNLAWNTNQWGDQNRKLIDARYGFKIVESIFTDPILPISVTNASPLAPASPSPSKNVFRESVMYSLEYNKYLYIKPGWELLPPNQVQYSWVSRNDEATRFTNTLPFANLLENSVIGDYARPWAIEQYFFTRPQTPASYSFFSGGPTVPRDIQRAFVAFSKEKGRYLLIDNPSDPYAQMTFQFVTTPCCSFRFDNTITFQNILDNTVLGSEAYGWEIPQFYFNRAVQPPAIDPFTQFWCIDQNGPYGCIGTRMKTCDWLCKEALNYPKDFNEYLFFVSQYLTNPRCYEDGKAFGAWWGQQDYAEFERWLQQFWIDCLASGGIYNP